MRGCILPRLHRGGMRGTSCWGEWGDETVSARGWLTGDMKCPDCPKFKNSGAIYVIAWDSILQSRHGKMSEFLLKLGKKSRKRPLLRNPEDRRQGPEIFKLT